MSSPWSSPCSSLVGWWHTFASGVSCDVLPCPWCIIMLCMAWSMAQLLIASICWEARSHDRLLSVLHSRIIFVSCQRTDCPPALFEYGRRNFLQTWAIVEYTNQPIPHLFEAFWSNVYLERKGASHCLVFMFPLSPTLVSLLSWQLESWRPTPHLGILMLSNVSSRSQLYTRIQFGVGLLSVTVLFWTQSAEIENMLARMPMPGANAIEVSPSSGNVEIQQPVQIHVRRQIELSPNTALTCGSFQFSSTSSSLNCYCEKCKHVWINITCKAPYLDLYPRVLVKVHFSKLSAWPGKHHRSSARAVTWWSITTRVKTFALYCVSKVP